MSNIAVKGGKIHLSGPHANGSELFCGMPTLGNLSATSNPANCWNCYDGATDSEVIYGERVSVDYGFAREDFLIFTVSPDKRDIANLINHLSLGRPAVWPDHVNIIGPVKLTSMVEMAIPNGIRY